MSDDDSRPASTADELTALAGLIEEWATAQLASPVVAAVERDDSEFPRWFIRVTGEEKSVFSIWFTLRQRSLHVETYLMPAPAEQHAAVYEYLLRRAATIHGMGFMIGDEDGIYLTGEVHNSHVDVPELDRLLGTSYMVTEACFRPAMRLGFASQFVG